jgi:type II secretory pathway pseudopilin PulG
MICKPRGSSRRCSRRGFTLLEVLIVVTSVAALLGVCAVTIQLLFRLSADSQTRLTAAVAIDRLGRQLRGDVHGSQSAQLAADPKAPSQPAALRLSFETGHEITYSPRAHSVVRSETRGGKAFRREEYVLGPSQDARFEVRDETSRRWAVLILSHSPERNRTDPPRPFEVIALAGKDRGLLTAPKGVVKP